MKYIAYYVSVEPLMPARELLYGICQMHQVETLEDSDQGIVAFIPAEEDDGTFKEALENFPLEDVQLSYETMEFSPKNWNLLWEQNFDPIEVEEKVRVRATFHQADENFPFEILIDPKMSFGTGHHQTTWLMLKALFDEDLQGKEVLDMGCGTGILGIFAAKKGASQVLGIDIEPWAAENARENAEKNQVEMPVLLGGDEHIKEQYDLIIANINRNVLLEQIPLYSKHVKEGGKLFMSGFYKMDLEKITEAAEAVGFKFISFIEKEDWVVARFKK